MELDKKKAVERIKVLVVILNCILASITLISLYTIASGAVEVDIPDENDFALVLDTRNREASFITNFTVTNHGLYDITNLDIHATVTTELGHLLIDYALNDLTIPSGDMRKFDIVAELPFERIDIEEWKGLMRNDSVFYLDLDIRADYLWGLSTFTVDETIEHIWEAPIKQAEGAFDEYYLELTTLIVAGKDYIGTFLEKMDELHDELEGHITELVTYLTASDERLEPLVDLIMDLDERIDNYYLEFLVLVMKGTENIDVFVDIVKEKLIDGGLLGRIRWEDTALRLELWPVGNGTSRILTKLSFDLFDDSLTVSFELSMLLIKGEDGYNIDLESFGIVFE
jgi:hypothetical protein